MLLRIAMVFALTDQTTMIDERHLQAALAWIRFWVVSVKFIFRSATQEKAQRRLNELGSRIVNFLAQHGRQSRTEISRDCLNGKLSKVELDRVLDELLAQAPPIIKVERQERIDGPGSATIFYHLVANSAKRANAEVSPLVARERQASEVSESGELSGRAGDASLTRIRSVRPPYADADLSGSGADAHDSLNSLVSPMVVDMESF
jgi:hypothetical protein